MKINYYEDHVTLTPESQAEEMQVFVVYKGMAKEKPSYSYEIERPQKGFSFLVLKMNKK